MITIKEILEMVMSKTRICILLFFIYSTTKSHLISCPTCIGDAQNSDSPFFSSEFYQEFEVEKEADAFDISLEEDNEPEES